MDNEIWKWFGSEFKVHCNSREDYVKIVGRRKSRPGGWYLFPDGHNEYDALIPAQYYNRVARLLGLPLRPVSRARKGQGLRMSEMNKSHRFLRNTNSKLSPLSNAK